MTTRSIATSGGPRAWATRVVQWNHARNAVKYGVHAYARVRGAHLERTGQVPEIGNIYAASSPKAGSQWLKALFSHPVVQAHTGLFTLPQLDFQAHLDRPFPAGTFVPGMYHSWPQYQQVPQPREHRVVYVFRDPRDLVVSGYHSAVTTHRKLNDRALERYRDELRAMTFDDALESLIRAARSRLEEVATWAHAEHHTLATFRLEEVDAHPRREIDRMLRHCGVRLTPDELDVVVHDVSRQSLQELDLAARGDGASHYRVERTTWRDVFKPQHHEAMDEIIPGLATRLGYPD